jgi:hypothetical protein
VLGFSYLTGIGSGLKIAGEYHYSGFGVTNIANADLFVLDQDYKQRFQRGDTQIIGRHALATVLQYEFTSNITGSSTWLQSPVDGSGLVSATVTWNLDETWTLASRFQVPYGKAPREQMVPASEYGGLPVSGLFQLTTYR